MPEWLARPPKRYGTTSVLPTSMNSSGSMNMLPGSNACICPAMKSIIRSHPWTTSLSGSTPAAERRRRGDPRTPPGWDGRGSHRCADTPRSIPRSRAARLLRLPRTSLEERRGDVVAHDHREEGGVEAVECAAVLAEEAPRILYAEVALDHRLEEDCEREGHVAAVAPR